MSTLVVVVVERRHWRIYETRLTATLIISIQKENMSEGGDNRLNYR